MSLRLNNIRIVLINTSHPGNIGAAARAMKTMGLSQLYLVQPENFPDGMATAMASGAQDILENAHLCESLEEAIASCTLVVGASARLRKVEWPELPPQAAAEKLCGEADSTEVALIFGREASGLTNDELDFCHYLTHISANPDYSSLNLAAAVQVFCYEIRKYSLSLGGDEAILEANNGAEGEQFASREEFESFFAHFQQALNDVNYLQSRQSQTLVRRLRKIFNRIRLKVNEIQLLRGILSAFQGRKSARRE